MAQGNELVTTNFKKIDSEKGYYVNGTQVIDSTGAYVGSVVPTDLALARGFIFIGNASGVAAAVDANNNGAILVGNGTDLNSVAVSGDVTLANTGAFTIANAAVNQTKLSYEQVTVTITGATSGTATATTGSVIFGYNVTAVTGSAFVKTVAISGTTVTVTLSASDTATVKVTLLKA